MLTDNCLEVYMQTDTPRFIASQELIWVLANGTERAFSVDIGEPYQIDARTWGCPVSLEGLHGRQGDTVGVSSLHALSQAIGSVGQFLGHLIDHGETFIYPQDRSPVDKQFLSSMFGLHGSAI
jgi:hypothetical protein